MATTVMQMLTALTQTVASSVDVWRAMKEMEQFVKVYIIKLLSLYILF